MHFLVWSVYSVAAILLFACAVWLTRGVAQPCLRWLFRLPLLALLFTPVLLVHEPLWWAPAIAAIAIELLAGNMDAARGYLSQLLMVVVLAAVIVVVWYLLYVRWRQSRQR